MMENLNSAGYEEFVDLLGNVIEHCPIIAAAVWSRRPFADVKDLHATICRAVDELPQTCK